MTRRDLCATLPRPHLLVTPLTLSKPSYQEEKQRICYERNIFTCTASAGSTQVQYKTKVHPRGGKKQRVIRMAYTKRLRLYTVQQHGGCVS